MIVVFNDTATTEIYTYCHTLSLHDALPIVLIAVEIDDQARHPRDDPRRTKPLGERADQRIDTYVDRDMAIKCRSEEHTSELQSLMRISYAVFCLKKKKTKSILTTTNYNIIVPLHNIIPLYNTSHKKS